MLGFLAIYALEFFASFFVRNVFVFSQGSLDVNRKKFACQISQIGSVGHLRQKIFFGKIIAPRIRNIGYLGRIIEEKRPDFVIDVFEIKTVQQGSEELIFQCPS